MKEDSTTEDEQLDKQSKSTILEFKNKLTKIASKQLSASSEFKKPLLGKIKRFQDLYANRVPKKLRIQFNVPVPVFSGMLDQLMADFDDPINAMLEAQHPSDYIKAQKIRAAFEMEKDSPDPNASWDLKARLDKKNAIFSGRGILQIFATSDPEYKSHLEVIDYNDFHSQPSGGVQLENHLFCGKEGVIRTQSNLEDGVKAGWYDKNQVIKLRERVRNKEYMNRMSDSHGEVFERFRAFGLDPESNNYVGEETYNLAEWCMTYKGTRYYVLFEPYTETWVRVEKLVEVYEDNLYPFATWATHEDSKVFWSKSYADDIYPIADAIITMFNQELTNREKRNLGARAYDKDMFKDVAKLDQAQYRADALVPADTQGGTKKIGEGIYRFDTPELQGTVNLIDWIMDTSSREMGVTDPKSKDTREPSKRVGVVYSEQSNIAKRIGYKSQSWTGMWKELIVRFVHGLETHMPQSMAIKMLGDLGFEWDQLTREDLKLKKPLAVKVISTTYEKQQSEKRKGARADSLKIIIDSPVLIKQVNPQWAAEEALRLGDWDEDEIKRALDTKSFASRESLARAHSAIQEMLVDKKPKMNYLADTTFMKTIIDYAMEHRERLGIDRFKQFMAYADAHAQIAAANMARLAGQMGRSMLMDNMSNPAPGGGGKPAPGGAPGGMPGGAPTSMPMPQMEVGQPQT